MIIIRVYYIYRRIGISILIISAAGVHGPDDGQSNNRPSLAVARGTRRRDTTTGRWRRFPERAHTRHALRVSPVDIFRRERDTPAAAVGALDNKSPCHPLIMEFCPPKNTPLFISAAVIRPTDRGKLPSPIYPQTKPRKP